ncbi:hypothetical protein DP188_17085 [Enterobacter hormaechei subsp. steigerwaltii]|nr:hypothetical protein AXA52_01035 [Enterobacter hormaechei]QHP00173.1 hypothetical protein C5I89_19520 [Enterobacter hormaechei]RAY81825.1 hypothetical protein DP188_17085 [Enterobacter hormaechei subsp. steigerwaltii]
MNVCVGTLKKSHTEQNGRGKCCGKLRTWQDRQKRRKNVTQVTEFSFSNFFSGGSAPPVRSFYDGFYTVSRADQRHIRATVGK